MKNFRLIGILFLLFCSVGAFGSDRGLIWEVSKDGHRSFLLGSIHFADDSFYPLPATVMDAYSASDILIVEVDDQAISLEEQQALIKRYGFYPEGTTVHDHLNAKTISMIRQQLNEFKVPLQRVASYRPGMLAITLTVLQANRLGYSADKGLDRYFLDKSRYKKKIRQIEDFEFQMKLISRLPEDDASLQDSFDNMKDYKQLWQGTIDAWKKGDAAELYELAIGDALKDYPALAEFFDVLFFERHDEMVDTMTGCLANKETCFIVVGAGHLVGNRGVVAMLQRQGYSVKQL